MTAAELPRENWATRVGFILAAVGSAVGLGNIWRFPFQVGQEGGAAFLLVYLLFVVLVGFPAILVEFVIGRNTELNTVGALREYGGNAWRYVGGLFVLIGFVILSYYSVVAGWALRYIGGSITGGYMNEPTDYFLAIASGWEAVAFHALFMLIVIGIVAFGIQRGIEIAVKVMVPAIIVLVVGLAIYAATLSAMSEAYAYYLSPDFGLLAENWTSIVPAAAGQAFFTLSLGMGVMITYASYLAENRNLSYDAGTIVGIDSGISFVVGLIVFPILFTAGVDPGDPGAGAIFISLAGAFAEISLGWLIGLIFFITLSIAALSSAISLMEVIVSYMIDEHQIDRKVATFGMGVAMFVVGIPTALDLAYLDLYDLLAANILLVVGALLLSILVGWVKPENALEELSIGIGNLGMRGRLWIWAVRIPVIIVLIVALVLGVMDYVEFLQSEFL